ncbi:MULTISPECIES: putative T7SS-secreted protein [unclassified Streptomyces]|uniref:putative T7SS-secreted protein n=1 Tax=unclassified Streptomyces TaxID=2593676 RepID=UPI0036C9C03F
MGLGDIVDGVKGGINKGLSVGEDLIDEGKKKVGEGVDYATNKVGDGLDHVGLHDAADAVEDWGDDVASDLGATPGEQQLGQTEEADELVHGNPDKIRESSKHLKDFHTAFDHVSQGMRKVDSSGWAGEGGDAFRKKFGVHPAKWAEASDACDKAAGALDAYADTVKWAQGKAKEAVELYKKGLQASKDAADAYNKKVDAYNAKIKANEDPGAKPEPFQDPGKADIKKAHETLTEARKQRNTAASDAQGKVKAALTHAPAEPPPLDRLGNDLVDGYQAVNTELTHVVGGALKGTAGLVNFARGLNPTDPYNLTHPAAYMQNVSMTLSGLVSTAAHPERIVTAAVDGFKKDPSEFFGRLIPEVVGTKGAGLARSGLRLGLKTALKDGAENAVRREARNAAERSPHATSRHPGERTCEKDPVDVATGCVLLSQTDVSLPAVLPLVLKREFSSAYRSGRWFGPSWSSTIDQRLEIDEEGIIFVGEDGLLLSYPHPAPGVPTLPRHGSSRWPLDREENSYTITDPAGGLTWHFEGTTHGTALLEQLDDRNGNWIRFEYDEEGSPRAVEHSAGYRLVVACADGRVTALSLAGAGSDGSDQELLSYGYCPDGHLAEIVNSCGRPTRFTYDEHGRILSWTDTNGRSFTYTYDEQNRCGSQSGEAGHQQSVFTYSPVDTKTGQRTTTITDSFGHATQFVINERCQVVARIDPSGHATRFARDTRNRLLEHTDPLGHRMRLEYDEAGNLVTVIRPDGRAARAEYNDLGLPVKITNPDGTVTRQTYDDRGNCTSIGRGPGQEKRYTYDEAGRLTSVTDSMGHSTTIHSNRAGLAVEVMDPLGAVTRYERDAFGRPTTITDPVGASAHLAWTREGHLARYTAPDNAVETWTYDGEGNCTSHTDALGGISRSEYTHFDLLAARTGPDGARHEFRHDTELRLTAVINPQGLTWSYTYDAAGNLASETDFDGRCLDYTYDAAGHLISRTDASGQTVHYERDFLGQVTRKDVQGQITEFAYDLTDQLAQATSPDCTLTLLRDRFGRLRSETVNGRTLSYTYDEWGRLIGRTTPTGATTTWQYDAVGRPTRMSTAGRAVDFAYDAAGREVSRHVGDSLSWTNQFDQVGRLTARTIAASARRRAIQQRSYSYRADGHLTDIEDDAAGPRRISLDPSGRVTAIHSTNWSETYAYDEAGNQVFASWPPNHPGHEATGRRSYTGTQLTGAGAVRYEHDAQGRVTLRQKTRLSRKPDTWRYEWDTEDRLTSAVTPDGTRWRYTYDPLGRRTSKLRLTDDGKTVVERTDFTWDGTTLCEQTTVSTQAPHPVTVTWGHRGLHPITQTERVTNADAPQSEIDARFFAIITDLVGTPTMLVDEDGDIAWQTRRTLWGTTAWAVGNSAYTPLRFPGQYFDPETGLHHNHFRQYDPETARYLTSDPLGLAPAPNPSAYVHNPHLWADPLGLTPCEDAAENAKANKTTPLGKEIPTRDEGSVGSTTNHKYKQTFFNEHPQLKGKVVVHHAIEQQVLKRYPGLFSPDEIHSLENLRGIPKGDINSRIHLSEIRVSWNEFYRTHPNPTRQEVLDHVTQVDDSLGNWFNPRIR